MISSSLQRKLISNEAWTKDVKNWSLYQPIFIYKDNVLSKRTTKVKNFILFAIFPFDILFFRLETCGMCLVSLTREIVVGKYCRG